MGGYIVFGADPVSVGIGVSVNFFVSVHHLLNQSMDFDQTYIYTLLGEGKSWLDFDDHDLIFKVTGAL